MKYVFVGSHKDIDTLDSLGYFDNCLGNPNKPIELYDYYGLSETDFMIDELPGFDGINFEAIKTFHDKFTNTGVAVAISCSGDIKNISVYRYRGQEHNHKQICMVRDKEKYIQELIDCNLVKRVIT